MVGFTANEKTNNVFIHYWFSFFQAILESQAPESAQKNINLKIFLINSIRQIPLEIVTEWDCIFVANLWKKWKGIYALLVMKIG